MRTMWTLPVLLGLIGSFIFSNEAFAEKDLFLDGLSGSWRGKGFITSTLGAKEEAIRCRLKNRRERNSPRLVLSGNCGIGGILIPMSGWIKQSGKSKNYTASLFRSLSFLSVDRFSGSLRGTKLKLNFKGRDKVSKVSISAFVTIHSRGKTRFDIQLSSTDPKSRKVFKVGTIKFSRR